MTKTLRFFAVLLGLATAGCSSLNVNPPAPRAGSGYVDFYSDSRLGLSWKVKRATAAGETMRAVFSEFKPVEGSILRLATPPGTHQFEVWFSNQVTEGPRTVSVQVFDGKVTPVHVTLTPAGSASVLRESYEHRPTARATRQVTRTSAEQNVVFRIDAAAESPREYQPKERMAYWATAVR